MEQKEITDYKFETISVLAVIPCRSILIFSFALLFNVGQNLFLYLFFLVPGFILAYALCKYFTGTFEIIINDQQQTAIVRWEKKVPLTFIKEQSIDLKSLRIFKEWSGRVNNRVNFYFIDKKTAILDISSIFNTSKNQKEQAALITHIKRYTDKK
ncbi:hypothetical protein [Flavobacterium sp. 14A]|uniref:hypothetical protein n=1 Tax=Flavobacterium sp. 14A TaxID=2735896 RepID=UPI0015705630|nr:hypothetical protein [Flavobacterium sp. 14A]NRT12663.1 hypothetical protein [Flavobacterium sp. 14A]